MRQRSFGRMTPIILAAALVWLLPTFAAAQAVTTQATAMELFNPWGVPGPIPQVGLFTSPGTVACPGAQPTGDPAQPCPPGSRIHVRGVSGMSRMASGSPLLAGSFYWEMNANWDAAGTGPAWGSFRLELDAGGVWEGSWTNKRSKVEDGEVDVWVGHASFIGRGTTGGVEGMQLRLTVVGTTYTLMPFFWAEPFDAEILVPPSL